MDVVQALSMSLVVCVSVIMDDSKRMCTPTYQSSPAETLKVVEEVDMRGIIHCISESPRATCGRPGECPKHEVHGVFE